MSEQVYVVGTGPSGLAAALAIGQANSDVNVLVFEQVAKPVDNKNEANLPVILHAQGKAALASLNVVEPTFPVTTISVLHGSTFETANTFGAEPDILTMRALLDGIRAKANSLPNLSFHTDGQVTGIDTESRRIFVETSGSATEQSRCQAYDLPKVLILAEDCELVHSRLSKQVADSTFELADSAGVATLVISGLSDPGSVSTALQVFTKGTSSLISFPEIRAAVLTTPADNVNLLSDATAVASLLKAAGAPAELITAAVSAAKTTSPIIHRPGHAKRVGFTTKLGDQIALVGPSAVCSQAPLCLDVNAALHSGVLMAQSFSQGGAPRYNTLYIEATSDLSARSTTDGDDVSLAPLGLSQANIARLCAGSVPLPRRIRKVLLAPVRLVDGLAIRPIGGVIKHLSGSH